MGSGRCAFLMIDQRRQYPGAEVGLPSACSPSFWCEHPDPFLRTCSSLAGALGWTRVRKSGGKETSFVTFQGKKRLQGAGSGDGEGASKGDRTIYAAESRQLLL